MKTNDGILSCDGFNAEYFFELHVNIRQVCDVKVFTFYDDAKKNNTPFRLLHTSDVL